MALVKCPDCKKMVSPRVTQCPFCGCPSDFFIATNNGDTDKTSNSKTGENHGIQRKDETESLKTTFKFWGIEITYPSEVKKFAKLYGELEVLAEEACTNIAMIYASQDLDKALNTIASVGNDYVDKALSIGIQYLFKNNIFINKKQLIDNGYWRDETGRYVGYQEYSKFYSPILKEYLQIENARIQMQRERELQIQSRPRWQGGGFGITGAIKGAVTAGALNMGSDFLHSFGDAANRTKDARVIASQIKKLYTNKNTLYTLCEGIKICIRQIFNEIVYEMQKKGLLEKYVIINYSKAIAIYENTLEYAQDMNMDIQQVLSNLIKCVIHYPGERRFYEILFDHVIAQADDDFFRFLEFWNLTEMFSSTIENYKFALDFDSYFENVKDTFTQSITVSLYYKTISPCLYKYYKHKGELAIPKNFSKYATYIQHLIDDELKNPKYSGALTQYELTEWIPEGCNIYEFVDYLKYIRETVQVCFLNRMELYGDADECTYLSKELLNEVKQDNDVVLMNFNYYVKEGFLFSTEHNNGLAITTKYIILLKDLTKFNICDIEEIVWATDGAIKISDGKKSAIWRNEYLNDYKYKNVIDHFGKLLVIYCVRYGKNSKLWNPKMTTKKPTER